MTSTPRSLTEDSMSDLNWSNVPQVNPQRPDKLVLDFSGEVHPVSTG